MNAPADVDYKDLSFDVEDYLKSLDSKGGNVPRSPISSNRPNLWDNLTPKNVGLMNDTLPILNGKLTPLGFSPAQIPTTSSISHSLLYSPLKNVLKTPDYLAFSTNVTEISIDEDDLSVLLEDKDDVGPVVKAVTTPKTVNGSLGEKYKGNFDHASRNVRPNFVQEENANPTSGEEEDRPSSQQSIQRNGFQRTHSSEKLWADPLPVVCSFNDGSTFIPACLKVPDQPINDDNAQTSSVQEFQFPKNAKFFMFNQALNTLVPVYLSAVVQPPANFEPLQVKLENCETLTPSPCPTPNPFLPATKLALLNYNDNLCLARAKNGLNINIKQSFKQSKFLVRAECDEAACQRNYGSHVCDVCGQLFRYQSALKEHFLCVHTSEEKKPFYCKTCDKGFVRRNRFEDHNLAHTGVKPYSCSTCFVRFTSRDNAIKHIEVCSGAKEIYCSFCGRIRPTHSTWRSHIFGTCPHLNKYKRVTSKNRREEKFYSLLPRTRMSKKDPKKQIATHCKKTVIYLDKISQKIDFRTDVL